MIRGGIHTYRWVGLPRVQEVPKRSQRGPTVQRRQDRRNVCMWPSAYTAVLPKIDCDASQRAAACRAARMPMYQAIEALSDGCKCAWLCADASPAAAFMGLLRRSIEVLLKSRPNDGPCRKFAPAATPLLITVTNPSSGASFRKGEAWPPCWG